ncbi:uncharacterized protein STEHIDRAFT_164187 [Stereum hirsutum FP-91666 SS1]|uniref:Uncharacterized protein n=1 Tax=Stereum hirsutum (strain FP-91666) TaxID=721885 RepID=R7RX04_STEHR|nr:uncharacterized protein STEHIDRAFT_164187 [Stereum hirsutum FP-91666 SS1]EIM78932.1 hypothetical protein STEHIDRAFT_164187 [Stereum hirsutum FP-91666 SS1]
MALIVVPRQGGRRRMSYPRGTAAVRMLTGHVGGLRTRYFCRTQTILAWLDSGSAEQTNS